MGYAIKNALRFPNILLVDRQPRIRDRLYKQAIGNPFLQKLIQYDEQNFRHMHERCLQNLIFHLEEKNHEVSVVPEDEITLGDAFNKNLIIAFGNDHTLLKTSSIIRDYNIPLIGVSTSVDRQDSQLMKNHITFKNRRGQANELVNALNDSTLCNFSQRSRIRLQFRQEFQSESQSSQYQSSYSDVLALNEIFVAEQDVSAAARIRVEPEDDDLGLIKSSGIIVSTGTGSTGWLYNARQVSSSKVQKLMENVGTEYHSRYMLDRFAKQVSGDTIFKKDARKMFFFVREGFSLKNRTEGFCKSLTMTSEMLKGQVVIDGWAHHGMGMGDKISLEITNQEQDLTLMSTKMNIM